jgi:hypothetical protein
MSSFRAKMLMSVFLCRTAVVEILVKQNVISVTHLNLINCFVNISIGNVTYKILCTGLLTYPDI